MKIYRQSPMTGKWNQAEIPVTPKQLKEYEDGALLQHAFPNLNNEQREFIKTGYTPTDWKNIFGGKLSATAGDYVECSTQPQFKLGDVVTFTNDYGVVFPNRTIIEVVVWCEGDYANDFWRYHVSPSDSPWYPHKERNLSLEK